MKNFAPLFWCVAIFIAALSSTEASAPQMFGVNLSGGEFGSNIPGTYGTDYIYPGASDFNYYNGKGLTFIRLPFRWERVQHSLNATLDPTEMGRLDATVALAHARGMKILLDMHNYEYYDLSGTSYLVGSAQVPLTAYQNVWGQLAAHYQNETAIYGYDIMNEPKDTLVHWQSYAQAAVNTIRQYDTSHYVFVEGVNYSGAQSWLTSNSTLSITDPANLLVYSAHSYWDANHDGTYGATEQGTATTGVNYAQPFVSWITSHGYNGHIGEYGVPNNSNNYLASWETALNGFLAYLKANNISGTYWSAGPWWGTYPLSCEPTSNFTVDALQMGVLENYTQSSTPPNLLSAVSVQAHAGVNYGLPLPLTGKPGVECRRTSGTLYLVATFDQLMTAASATVSTGSGSVANTTFSGDTVTVQLGGVPDADVVTVALTGLNGTTGSATIPVDTLESDVNGDGVVNVGDGILLKAHVNQTVGSSNFQYDINLDGHINSSDGTIMRSDAGHALP